MITLVIEKISSERKDNPKNFPAEYHYHIMYPGGRSSSASPQDLEFIINALRNVVNNREYK